MLLLSCFCDLTGFFILAGVLFLVAEFVRAGSSHEGALLVLSGWGGVDSTLGWLRMEL